MSRSAGILVALSGCAWLGCALPGGLSAPAFLSGKSADARIAVELYRGFASAPDARAVQPERVEIVVDTTASMQTATAAGPGRYVAARNAAARLVRQSAPDAAIGLHAVGAAGDGACTPVLHTARSAAGDDRGDLVRHIEALTPSGEASLAAAIAGLGAGLAEDPARARSRVVIFSDLAGECEENLCEPVAALVSSGARVDVVLFGDAAVPSCIEKFDIRGTWRGAAEASPTQFRATGPEGSGPVTAGVAGEAPVAVSPGTVQVVVDLEPPLRVDPVEIAPGETARLRILDFPALDPPVREWSWEIERAPAGGDVAGEVADVR